MTLYFFAETHGFLDDFGEQKEIVEEINPEYLLLEQLQDQKVTDHTEYEKIISDDNFSHIRNIIKLCFHKNIKIIGIDLKDFGFTKEIKHKIENNIELSKSEKDELSKIIEKRQKHHIKIINKYLDMTKSNILVSLGAWHFSKQSKLLGNFNNYTLIFPSNKKGKMIIEPTKEKIEFKTIKINKQ